MERARPITPQAAPDPQRPDIDENRRRAASLLARATRQELEAAWSALPQQPAVKPVRGPETGLVMVRGRIGGGGQPFNLGEATVTRATVMLDSGTAGHAHALAPTARRPGSPPYSTRFFRKKAAAISSSSRCWRRSGRGSPPKTR